MIYRLPVVQALPDLVAPNLAALFVGINPSLRSAELGHHYAGRGNRFWKLLFDSGLTPEPFTFEDDRRLLELGFGSTNIVDRATRSADELSPKDYALGKKRLAKKVERFAPKIVVCVGLVVFRQYFASAAGARRAVRCGLQEERIGSSPLFVVPNPSGRNAHFTYAGMVEHYRTLAEAIRA